MDDLDREILIKTGERFPLISEPFIEVANKLKIRQDEVILRLKELLKEGIIRKFGASINHRKIGLIANAMVVWRVPEDRVEEVGSILSTFREITHCYERRTVTSHWEYNLFTVIHGYSRGEVELLVKKFSDIINIKDYVTLYSIKEFKKTSHTYIQKLGRGNRS